jgi:hypothetical protein
MPAAAVNVLPARGRAASRLRPLCAHLHAERSSGNAVPAVPAGPPAQQGGLAAGQLVEYEREGVVILRGVLDSGELGELRKEVARILDRAPASDGAAVDRRGEACLGAPAWWQFAPALRSEMNREIQVEMRRAQRETAQSEASSPREREWPVKISNWMTFSEPGVRLYGHPKLLAAAQAINGADFVPFSESLVVKHAGYGAALAWHQDGSKHWADGAHAEHGFNFMVNLYDCSAANALWVLPRSHRRGQIEVTQLLQPDGSVALPGCPSPVPVLCRAGDVAIVNRNAVHGSYANASADPRHTFIFGFHKRRAVDGVHDLAAIEARRQIIPLAIGCRAAKYRAERPFAYEPLASGEMPGGAALLQWHGLEAHSELLHTVGLGL